MADDEQNSGDVQPAEQVMETVTPAAATGQWLHGMFGCMDSGCMLCLKTFVLPCIMFGKNAEAMGESCCTYGCFTFIPGFNWYTLSKMRGRIREQKGIEGTFMNDCLTYCVCGICNLAQETQEMADQTGISMDRE